MSGHNKWSKIKRKKGAEDAKRSKIFSKIIKEIQVAVREGNNVDPETNPRLRLAISNGKGANMPKENIERAIKKAGESSGDALDELIYEGYLAGGIAVIIECTTDNLNRTTSNIRHYFSKYGGNLATKGSVDFMFDRKGVFTIPEGDMNEDDFTLELIDAGAEDVELDDNYYSVTTLLEDYGNMQRKLEEMKIQPESAELLWIPKTTSDVDVETAKKALKVIEIMEEDDDVQNVSHNMELTEELLLEIE